MARVVGIVATMSCCDMGVTVPVTSRVWAPWVRSLVLIRRSGVWRSSPGGVGRAVTYARGRGDRARRCLRLSLWGSGETDLTPEAQGVGRGDVCVRASRGSGESWFGPEFQESDDLGFVPWRSRTICFVLWVFCSPDLGILFYGIQQ